MKYTAATLALVAVLLGFLYQKEVKESAQLSEQYKVLVEASKRASEQRKSDRNTLVARERQIASQQALLAQAQEGLSQALRANNEWSNTNVPTDVQEALVGLSDGPAGGLPDGLRKPYAGSAGESPPTD